MDPATLIPEVLRHLHSAVPTVGSHVPLEGADAMELTDDGFEIGFLDGRSVELSSPVKYKGLVVFFTGYLIDGLGIPRTYTVQLVGERSIDLYRRVVDTLLAA